MTTVAEMSAATTTYPQFPKAAAWESHVAQNDRLLFPKVAHYWDKVAHNYRPLALQAGNVGI